MKRFSLGLAALTCAASLTTYAAVPTDAAPFQVNIPNLSPGIEMSFTGYALRPSSTGDEDYAVAAPIAVDDDDITATYAVQSVDPDYEWAFAIMLGYIFPCSGNDIRANWIHYDNSETSSTTADGTTFLLGPTWDIDYSDDAGFAPFTAASSTEDVEYDAVDVTVGQFVNLGTRLQTRLFAGLRYARIEDDRDDIFTSATTTDADGDVLPGGSLTADYDSKFEGLGPVFGVDSSYHLGYCFGLVAHADMALLVGDVKASTTFTQPEIDDGTGLVVGTDTTSITSDDDTRIIPGFDAKLGLDWTYPFTYGCNCDEGEFSIEAGYQWTYYIDAVDRLYPDEAAPDTDDPVTFDSVERVTNGIGFDGPYVTLTLKI